MDILLVDDHALFREALRNFLENSLTDCRVQDAGSPAQALADVERLARLDMILLDLDFPESSGLEALPRFREVAPATPVVVLSASERASDIRFAMRHGAAGYLSKTTPGDTLLDAIGRIAEGDIYLPPHLSGVLCDHGKSAENLPGVGELTDRQMQVLRLMAHGLSNKRIARAVGIAEGTVKLHVTAILKALRAANRTEAVITATRLGLVSSG